MVLDGVDLSTIGLDDVRKAISIIPQEPLLFNGTMRTNLDPFGQYDDAALWDALKRAYLVEESRNVKGASIELEPEGGPGAKTPTTRFTLDTLIEDEGGNLSVGQVSRFATSKRHSAEGL
jgi:ABC-type multidrug transport system fused ATPase/permease subunit